MFTKTIIAVLVFASLLGYQPQRTDAEPQVILTPKEYISLYASNKAIEKELLLVAKCESNFKPTATHHNDGKKGSTSYGIYQYKIGTFEYFSKLMGENLDYYSYHDQIKLTAWIFANRPDLKKHWSCSKITKVIK